MFGRLFRRLTTPAAPPPSEIPDWRSKLPPAAKDWEVGDVAKCIVPTGGVWMRKDHSRSVGPDVGQLLRVANVVADADTVWLNFHRWPGSAYPAGHFRKLGICSADFSEQLRTPICPAAKKARKPELVP